MKKEEVGSSFYLTKKDLVVVTSYDAKKALNDVRRRYVSFKQPDYFVCYFEIKDKCLTMTSTITWPINFRESVENIRMLNNSENVILKDSYIQLITLPDDKKTDSDEEMQEEEMVKDGEQQNGENENGEKEGEKQDGEQEDGEKQDEEQEDGEKEDGEKQDGDKEGEQEDGEKEDDVVEKKKRGRPKKERDDKEDDVVEKKKRGRPKKERDDKEDDVVEKKKRGRPKKDSKSPKLRSIDARAAENDTEDDILDANVVEMDEGIPSSSKLKRPLIDQNEIEDCECDDTLESYVYVGKNSKGIKYIDLVERMVHFNCSNYALKALKMAVNETVRLEYATSKKKNMRHPLVFTMMSIEGGKLYFYSIGFGYQSVGRESFKAMKNAKICMEPYKDVYYDSLDIYPYHLYAYFTGIGIYVEHVKDEKFPEYKGVEYDEECDESEESWDIKSIRNMILHDPEDEDIAPSMMVLVDWEVSTNVGVFAEEPDEKSVLSWTAFHNLKDYNMFSCYLKNRAKGIKGTQKILTRFPMLNMTDEEAYKKRKYDKD